LKDKRKIKEVTMRTYRELQAATNRDFILRMLDERQKELNVESPLAKKCKAAQAWLDSSKEPLVENIPYYGDNRKISGAIVFVLENVPEPVQVFALERCIFTSMDDSWSGCIFILFAGEGSSRS
jgi:hypothetical protein